MLYDVIILGSGPAGLTSAVYATRGNLKTLVIAGFEYGGQLMLTTDVENYPGFPEGIQGPDLMDVMIKQAERFGAEFVYENATSVDFTSRPFKVHIEDKSYEGRSVIVATGASARWLGLESEKRLIGYGVSSCATCDGHFFRDMDLVVVGGGDTAIEEALFLAKLAKHVTVIHRRDELRASKIMAERAFKNPKIDFLWDSAVLEVLGEEKVSGVRVENVKTKEMEDIPVAGVFVAIGHTPNTKVFDGQIDMERGYIVVNDSTRTNVEGVFVAGDVHDYRYRQAVTAAGFGCMAAMDAEKWLEAQDT
ncbi:MAG: thioredoxin-disulfide reductase [Candidatus Thermoplasmatota archaeon]|nr:thioredoxin-disulfide reductase [Candidatus Thermoplasmatota archaeon]